LCLLKNGAADQPFGQDPGDAPQVSSEERKAYGVIQTKLNVGMDADKVLSLSHNFEKKYLNSVLLTYVYAFEATAHQQKGELSQTVDSAEKSIRLNPDNIMALIILSSILPQPQLLHVSDQDKQKKLSKAKTAAIHALELISRLSKQPSETDEAFKTRKNTIASEPHAALGMIHLQRAAVEMNGMDRDELAEAVQEYKTAVDLYPTAESWYRLGEVYEHENKIDHALASFSKASELGQGTEIQHCAEMQREALKKKQVRQAKLSTAN
jgi:tetratricopeptide (TPR) repeat protein